MLLSRKKNAYYIENSLLVIMKSRMMYSLCGPLSKVDCLSKCACRRQLVEFSGSVDENEDFLLRLVAVIEVSHIEI